MIGEFFIIRRRIEKEAEKIFSNDNDKILDLGCGDGPYYHKHIKGKIICFDITKTETTKIVGDADKLPFKENSFDKVISINSFYYLKNPFSVAEDVSKILKKNGKFVLVVPFFYPIHDIPADKYRFTEHGLRTLLEEHFKIEKIKPTGGIFNVPSIILHSIIKGFPLLFPKSTRSFIQVIMYVLYPLYIAVQLISILDVLDRTGRFPTYYFVVAIKK